VRFALRSGRPAPWRPRSRGSNHLSGLRRVSFTVASDDLEIALAWLLERFPAGFEERPRDGRTELAVYTDGRGEGELRGAFSRVRSEPVAGGWEDRWKEFHKPTRAGGLWIGPPWIPPPPGEAVVVVDPGRAFGTGAHATTRACIELLSRIEPGSLLDAGCGSGVVAVAAAKLGFGPVVAVDSDPVAVEVARGMAEANDVVIDVRVVDVLADQLPVAEVLVANIELGAVETLLGRSAASTAVTSGYLAEESPRAPGWTTIERLELGCWAADALGRAH
jgi:ribosomal protein L11 methyltransferase